MILLPISGGITALSRRDGMGMACCGMGSRGGAVCSQISLPQSCNEANWSLDFQAGLVRCWIRLGQGSKSDATFSMHSLLSSLELSVSWKIIPCWCWQSSTSLSATPPGVAPSHTPKHPVVFAVQIDPLSGNTEEKTAGILDSRIPLQLNCPKLGLQEALPIPVDFFMP